VHWFTWYPALLSQVLVYRTYNSIGEIYDFRGRGWFIALAVCGTFLYHFLLFRLTLGLSFLLAIMESTYVMTGKEIYKDMTQFWGNYSGFISLWRYHRPDMEFHSHELVLFLHYVGDIFWCNRLPSRAWWRFFWNHICRLFFRLG